MADVDFNALFKEIYADKVEDLIPDGVKLKKDIKFSESEKLGEKFVQPVMLSHEQGYTYAADQARAFSLNSAIGATFRQAEVTGTAGLLRTQLSYEQASKAMKGKRAFVDNTKQLVENLTSSMTKRIEIGLVYGSSVDGLAAVASAATRTGTGASARRVVTISPESWAPGIWAGMENAELDSHTRSGTQQNSAALKIERVNIASRQLTLSGSNSDLDAIVSTSGTSQSRLSFRGSRGVEFAGLDRIITNESTLFNIDAGEYDLWRGNTMTSSEQLSLGTLLEGVSLAVGKGLESDVCAYVSPGQYENLNETQSNLRRYTSPDSMDRKNGSKHLTFYGQNGMIEVKPSIYVKDSDVFVIPPKKCKRIGATDMTFVIPGKEGSNFFRELEDSAGYELRVFHHQALFIEKPGHCVKITCGTSLS